MSEFHQPYRQIHLDFHTSAQCQGVGVDFDAQQFALTLKDAHVESINIFGKCHHGYSYYPTKVGTMHPNLSFDLLGKQLEALHRVGIRAPIYVTIKWDDLAGIQHPEWVVINKDGRANMRLPLSNGWGWTALDVTSGYGDYLVAQAEELCRMYSSDVDGFWFDICFTMPNYSTWGQAQMRKAGLRIDDDAAVWCYADEQDCRYFERVTRAVRSLRPHATIFYNGTITPAMRKMIPYMTHFEIESLPTTEGAWGYLHYPLMARQARTYGMDMVAMTGRFHKSWADFGGLKTQDQLDYECGTIVAAGGAICVGDQLHPRGVLDPAVYRLIGKSFERIEKLEPWLKGAKPMAEIGILGEGQPDYNPTGIGSYSADAEGAAQMFLELGIQFDILDSESDFSAYPALVLPDEPMMDDTLVEKLESFMAAGGRLVMSGRAGLNYRTDKFAFKGVPLTFLGPVLTVPSYLRLDLLLVENSELAADYDYVFYDQAYRVRPAGGAKVFGDLRGALFNRTWEHFTSHQHAPVGDSFNSPLLVMKGHYLYFAAPLFSAYRNHDYWVYRAIVKNALSRFLDPALLLPEGPGWAEFTLHTQPATTRHPERRIVHVVCYHPRRTLQSIQHVDQSWQTSGMSVRVRLDGLKPSRVYLAPDEQPLKFKVQGKYVRVELPPIGAHAVVVIEG